MNNRLVSFILELFLFLVCNDGNSYHGVCGSISFASKRKTENRFYFPGLCCPVSTWTPAMRKGMPVNNLIKYKLLSFPFMYLFPSQNGVYIMNMFDWYSAGFSLVIVAIFQVIALGIIYGKFSSAPSFNLYWLKNSIMFDCNFQEFAMDDRVLLTSTTTFRLCLETRNSSKFSLASFGFQLGFS